MSLELPPFLREASASEPEDLQIGKGKPVLYETKSSANGAKWLTESA